MDIDGMKIQKLWLSSNLEYFSDDNNNNSTTTNNKVILIKGHELYNIYLFREGVL